MPSRYPCYLRNHTNTRYFAAANGAKRDARQKATLGFRVDFIGPHLQHGYGPYLDLCGGNERFSAPEKFGLPTLI
jgi:hypothetical protein